VDLFKGDAEDGNEKKLDVRLDEGSSSKQKVMVSICDDDNE